MKLKGSKLSGRSSARLVEHFIAGTPARTAAELVGVNRNTAIFFYRRLRQIISSCMPAVEMFGGEVEIDESYFGGFRKGKRGRGAAGKVPVFGILKRDGKVYTQVLPNMRAETFLGIIVAQVAPESIVYTDSLPTYNVLDVAGFRHHRVNHSLNFLEGKGTHINGIENFWNQAKRHLRKYNGIPKKHFSLYLKECEFRYNYGTPKQQLTTLKKWIKRCNGD